MTPRPALVATDLDGTLLRSDGTVSRRTIEVVRQVQDAGIQFVVASARPPRWLHGLLEIVGDHGVAICTNGAYVYDVARRMILAGRTIAPDVAVELVRELRAGIPGITFAVERSDGYGQEPAYVSLHEAPDGSPVAPIEALLEPPPGKMLARAPDVPESEFLAEVARIIGGRATVSFSGAGGLAEINAVGVTKAAVLADWCEARAVSPDDVWAFGDMPNDLPMLAWAGTSFAVANAHPAVTAQATYQCASNDEDGPAEVLEQMLIRTSA